MPAPHRTTTLVLGLALVAGCSTGGAGSVGSAPPEATAPDAVTLPIDPYRHTTWEAGRIILARELLVTDCLHPAGAAPPDRLAIERDTRIRLKDLGPRSNKRRYGVTSPADAATYGYHLPSVVDRAGRDAPPKTGDRQRSRCVREADDRLGAAALTTADLVRTIDQGSYRRSLTDPRVGDALRRWSACMTAKGYSHPDPTAAMSGFDLTTATVTAAEKATATADVECKHDTGLVTTWQDVEAALQNAEISTHEGELRVIAEQNDRLEEQVRSTIDDPARSSNP